MGPYSAREAPYPCLLDIYTTTAVLYNTTTTFLYISQSFTPANHLINCLLQIEAAYCGAERRMN